MDSVKRRVSMMLGPKNQWEQLYDFNTNTYFFRNKVTGEFSRTNPVLSQIEAKSSHVPPKNQDPLWETGLDDENGEEYWTNIETGKIVYTRPEKGTFLSELPMSEFRKLPKRNLSELARKSIRGLASLRKPQNPEDEDESPMDYHEDVFFEDLSRGNAAHQFDAAAMLGVGGSTSSDRSQ